MGNNTPTMEWMRKLNFTNDGENDTDTVTKLTTARHIARISQDASSCLYTQRFPGDDKDVSDSFSRDHHLSTTVLANLLSSSIPHHLPPNFKIAPLPSVINSWLCSLLVKMPINKARRVQPKMSLITSGAGGANSSTVSNSKMILTSSRSPNHGNIKSYSPHSPKLSTKPDSLMQLSLPWLKTHIDHVAQAFRHGQRLDPRLDNNGRLSILLS